MKSPFAYAFKRKEREELVRKFFFRWYMNKLEHPRKEPNMQQLTDGFLLALNKLLLKPPQPNVYCIPQRLNFTGIDFYIGTYNGHAMVWSCMDLHLDAPIASMGNVQVTQSAIRA